MKPAVYETMARVEASHWWFTSRRRIVTAVLERKLAHRRQRILEIGCGTGGNFDTLRRFGSLTAVECDEAALALARRHAGVEVLAGSLPDGIPCSAGAWDLVVMLDVLEHVGPDLAALETARSLLAEGGLLLLTVPAHAWLWSEHDEIHHHHRRYSGAELRRKVEAAGFRIDMLGYYNVFLMPLVAAVRALDKWTGRQAGHDLELPPAPLNGLLATVFSAERHLVGRLPLPPGVSLIMTASREAGA